MSALRILVAEDNPINQKIVVRTLQKHGAKVVVVANGQEAIDQIKEQSFDVVLMDMEMPVMDGYTACKHIRETLNSKIPIIAMTAHTLPGEAEKCINAGANDYVSKPFDHNLLFNQIHNLVDVSANQPEQHEPSESNEDIVDFSYVMELAGDKPDYIHQVLSIFMEHTPPGLAELQQLVNAGDDWDKISAQAHFLKSSVGIVKVKGMHEMLQQIESLAKEKTGKEAIVSLLDDITNTFSQAEAIIRKKMDETQ